MHREFAVKYDRTARTSLRGRSRFETLTDRASTANVSSNVEGHSWFRMTGGTVGRGFDEAGRTPHAA